MSPLILIINCGSSSLKFALLQDGEVQAEGLFERLGGPNAAARWRIAGGESHLADYPNAGHEAALAEAVRLLEGHFGQPLPVDAVGHRVVHGGEYFRHATLIDHDVIAKIELCRDLAPLHNPAHARGIRVARKYFPDIPQVAVFDTAFHQTMPEHAWLYAVPYQWYTRYGVRRYGAHGTSHAYVAGKAAQIMGKPLSELQMITAHLGNGCSACAIKHGESVDTTMGLTPLEGLVMGTRSGDVDANLQPYLRRVSGMPAEEVTEALNHRSGLLGVSGVSNDMRAILQAAGEGYQRATLAIDLFAYRLAKGILAMAAGLDRVDALVFTGGIGENNARVREQTLGYLRLLNPLVDPDLNQSHGRQSESRITHQESGLLALVIPTSEERAIAEQTATFVRELHPL